MIVAYTFGDYGLAVVAVTLGLVPFGVSVWALLDVANRPAWAWALANRDRAHWVAGIVFTSIIVGVGLAVAIFYLTRVRPQVAAVEGGHLDI